MPSRNKLHPAIADALNFVWNYGPQDLGDKYGVQEFLCCFHEDKSGHVRILLDMARRYGFTRNLPMLLRLKYMAW